MICFDGPVILWELASRAEPYEGMSWAAVRVGVLKRKQRPLMPKNLDQDYVEVRNLQLTKKGFVY